MAGKIRGKRKRAAKALPVTARDVNIVVGIEEVDNPYFAADHRESESNPRRVQATVNVNESKIQGIKADEAQMAAARKFQRLWNNGGGRGAGAIDYARERVDGGGAVQDITDSQIDAQKELDEARKSIGMRPYQVVRLIVGEGYRIKDISRSHREQTTYGDYLKHALTDLAVLWGYQRATGVDTLQRQR